MVSKVFQNYNYVFMVENNNPLSFSGEGAKNLSRCSGVVGWHTSKWAMFTLSSLMKGVQGTYINKLDKKWEEISNETMRDCHGGNVNHKSLS